MNHMTIKDLLNEIHKGLQEEDITEDTPFLFHLLPENDDGQVEPLIPKNMFKARTQDGEAALGFNFIDRRGAISHVLQMIRGENPDLASILNRGEDDAE